MTISKRRLRPLEVAILVVPLCGLAFAWWRMAKRPEPPQPYKPPMYSVTGLGVSTGRSLISDMNDQAEVVGAWSVSSTKWRPVVWRNGKMNFIGMGTGGANAINNAGDIVGEMKMPDGKACAFLWRKGKFQNLGALSGLSSSAFDINNKGEIVGSIHTSRKNSVQSLTIHAFLWKNGKMSDISPSNSDFSQAFAISDTGEIAGLDTSRGRGMSWKNAVPVPLEKSAAAHDINNKGVILGTGNVRGMELCTWKNGHQEAVRFEKGVETGLVYSHCMNDQGQIVGTAQRQIAKSFRVFAFVHINGQAYDLNDRILASGWYLRSASAINNRGQIAGEGTLNGKRHFFLLTPISYNLQQSSTRSLILRR